MGGKLPRRGKKEVGKTQKQIIDMKNGKLNYKREFKKKKQNKSSCNKFSYMTIS